MNLALAGGNPPRPFRHFRMAERCTPDLSRVGLPFIEVLVQKYGCHQHQLCRPTSTVDARRRQRPVARGKPQIVGTRLALGGKIFPIAELVRLPRRALDLR